MKTDERTGLPVFEAGDFADYVDSGDCREWVFAEAANALLHEWLKGQPVVHANMSAPGPVQWVQGHWTNFLNGARIDTHTAYLVGTRKVGE